MGTRFDWQAGDDDGQWETIAQEDSSTRRARVPGWLWAVVLTAIVVTLGGGYVAVRRRYEAASQRIAFQIQSVVDLEARASQEGDEELFLAQQDETSVPWYAGPVPWLGMRFGSGRSRSSLPPMAVSPATVEEVDLRGDVAWVQVVEGDPPIRRVRFYRQTDQGWLHTAPDPDFWQEPVEHHHGEQLAFYYHKRDQPYIDSLVDQVSDAFYQVCGFGGCRKDERFRILIYPEYPKGDLLFDLALPSPWLSGIPVDEDASERVPHAVLYAVERAVMAWATTGEPVTQYRWGQPLAVELWLGVSPITPEMVALGTPLIRLENTWQWRSSSPERDRYTLP
jgi:hypothetical protein